MLIRSGFVACVWSLATLMPVPASAVDPPDLIRAAIRVPCLAGPETSLAALAEKLPAQVKRSWVHFSPAGISKRRLIFDVDRDVLTLQFAGITGSPDYVSARYGGGAQQQPLLTAIADSGCAIHTARRLSYDVGGRPGWLQNLDGGLRPIGKPEPLNPPVPTGQDPPGILVGVVDTGVNYLLPDIATRLARNSAGEILGYDFWDLDRRPFDVSLTPDPFFPSHHGTQTADLVLEGAPVAKLVPYRYPHHDMGLMSALIADAAAHRVRLLNLSLDSVDREGVAIVRETGGGASGNAVHGRRGQSWPQPRRAARLPGGIRSGQYDCRDVSHGGRAIDHGRELGTDGGRSDGPRRGRPGARLQRRAAVSVGIELCRSARYGSGGLPPCRPS
jgi:hypothetical protein